MDDLTTLGYQAQLDLLRQALDAHGLAVQMIEPNDQLPIPSLMVSLDEDDKGRARNLAVTIMPFGDEDDGGLDSTQLVQFYAHLPFEVDADSEAVCQRAVAIVNPALAVGHFAMQNQQLFFRYVLAMPSDTTFDADMAIELIGLLSFHQEHFGDYFEGLIEGEIALSTLPALLAAG